MNEIILRVKTAGSRVTRNLRPDIKIPEGAAMTVCEYSSDDSTCVVQVFGSEHELVKDKVTDSDLKKLGKGKQVVEELDKSTYGKRHKHIRGISINMADEVDEESKEFKHHNIKDEKGMKKNFKFKRKDRQPRLGQTLVLDESDE